MARKKTSSKRKSTRTQVYVLDTSITIERIPSREIKAKKLKGKIIIPNAVIAELEHQANQGQEIGFIGLEEIQELQELKNKKKIKLEFIGPRPSALQIKYAKTGGEIDALIRQLAYEQNATLITADKVQAESAKAYGIKVKFIEIKKPEEEILLKKFFDKHTMSVHIKENCYVLAKKGTPGNWKLVKLKEKLSPKNVQELAKDTVEKTRLDPESFVEISRKGSTIVQYKDFRIVITKPPVSDGWEITAVKPLIKLKLEDYKLPEKLFERIKEKAHGVLIAGEVGSGKTTLAQAIAEFYAKQGKIIKTVESPRDLQLIKEITQFSKNFTTSEEIHDILFLSRPDTIIFDEIRDTPDFKLYIDLRLAGSSCIGVMHSATPVDAIQRFITRLETGMIPSVIDTILFMANGKIEKVLTLKMIVKVPSGMTEADLARPVVEVRDFFTSNLEYEIYSYGEQTVVVPVEAEIKSPLYELAARYIEEKLRKYNIKAEVLSLNKARIYVPRHRIGEVIGKQGSNIESIEKKLGINIEVQELKEEAKEIPFKTSESKKNLVFFFDKKYKGKKADLYCDEQFITTVIIAKSATVNFHKKSKLGKQLLALLDQGKRIKAFLA